MMECGRVGAMLGAPPCGVGAHGQGSPNLPLLNRLRGWPRGKSFMLPYNLYRLVSS